MSMMSTWLQLHSHLREREFLRGKITILFEFAQVFFSVYHPSRFNKYWFIVLAKCHFKNCKTNLRPLQPSLKILQFWACAVPYMGCHVSLRWNSLLNFPAIVSHDCSVISLALNNIFCLKNWAFNLYTLLSLVLTRDSNNVLLNFFQLNHPFRVNGSETAILLCHSSSKTDFKPAIHKRRCYMYLILSFSLSCTVLRLF